MPVQKQCEACADTAVADIDCDHNLLVAKIPHQVKENYTIPKEQT
jgi:hypothetical protein